MAFMVFMPRGTWTKIRFIVDYFQNSHQCFALASDPTGAKRYCLNISSILRQLDLDLGGSYFQNRHQILALASFLDDSKLILGSYYTYIFKSVSYM